MATQNENVILDANYSAAQVADYFVLLSSTKMVDEGIPEGVSPLKLQKLLYFAQAASLALFNKKLFVEDIEAWKYGPVVSSIYHHFKSHQNESIVAASDLHSAISTEDREFIKGVWDLFDKYSASELVEMTHRHDPWILTYKDGENVVIPPELMRDYYKNVFAFTGDTDGEE